MLDSCVALFTIGGVVLYSAANGSPNGAAPPSLKELWTNGFGNVYPTDVLPFSQDWSVAGNILLANAPQLILSVMYVSYNQYITLMCVAAEAMRFCEKRDYLRVSRPRGQQRSTYWLGLPFIYSIPLMTVCGIMHWALSQSLFLTELRIVDPNTKIDPDGHKTAVGYSIIGFIVLLGIAAIMVIALILVGLRKYPAGMPLLSSCSLAVAASCHGDDHRSPSDAEDESAREAEAEAPLMYGVTAVVGPMRGRVGFSSEAVQPLEKDWIYDGTSESLGGAPVELKVLRDVSIEREEGRRSEDRLITERPLESA